MKKGFAVWITGLPASGKSSVTKELVRKLGERGIGAVVLESDEMRRVLTPEPVYSSEERDRFYRMLARIGEIITRSGVNVIFDATANKRAYRDHARSLIPNFVEAFIDCPVEICKKRDPKGIYARAAAGAADSVPGIQVLYEPPARPEVTLDCQTLPTDGADAVIRKLIELTYLPI
jgi:adenylylsulfate kinase